METAALSAVSLIVGEGGVQQPEGALVVDTSAVAARLLRGLVVPDARSDEHGRAAGGGEDTTARPVECLVAADVGVDKSQETGVANAGPAVPPDGATPNAQASNRQSSTRLDVAHPIEACALEERRARA